VRIHEPADQLTTKLRSCLLSFSLIALLGACRGYVDTTYDKLEMLKPPQEISVGKLGTDGLVFENDKGLWLRISICPDNGRRICGSLRLPEGHEFKLLDSYFTVLASGKEVKRLSIGDMEYFTWCHLNTYNANVPYQLRLQERNCPPESEGMRPISGPLQSELTRQSISNASTTLVWRHRFSSELTFQGSTIKSTFSFHKEMKSREFTFRSAELTSIDGDFSFIPPRFRLDQAEIHLPPISVRRVTEKIYFSQA
jgi:hypothetical protein